VASSGISPPLPEPPIEPPLEAPVDSVNDIVSSQDQADCLLDDVTKLPDLEVAEEFAGDEEEEDEEKWSRMKCR
jgi:hypothetical protein